MDSDSDTIEEHSTEPSSPFKSMSLTTDKLSMRESHIGPNYPDSRLMVLEYQKSAHVRSHQSMNNKPLQEFVPYPPDIISTTVERSSASDWGYQSKTAIISQRTTEWNRLERSQDKQRLKRLSSSESVVTNNSHQECNGFDKQSVVSLQSNFSSDTNLMAIEYKNACNQTEEVVKINEYIQVSITDDSTGPLFDIKRKLALERGRAEQLDHIMEDMVKERSELQMKLHSMEKVIKLKNEKIREMNVQRETLLSDSEELKSGINKWETIVSEYQEVVDAKTQEIQALNEDIIKLNDNNANVKINLEHMKIDLDSKDNTIKELTKKISQMSANIDSLIQNKVSLEDDIKRKKTEMEDILSQKEWSELELNKVRVHLNETHQKLVTEQQISISARNESERVQTLNTLLKQELIEVKHKAVKEKENLMKHLEGIGAQMVIKENEMQLLSPKREGMISSMKIEEISDDFKQKLHQKNLEIERLNQEFNKISENNKRLVHEKDLLNNRIDSLQCLNSDKDHEIQTSKAFNSDLELKFRGLNIDFKRQKELNEILRKDKKESESKLNALVIENKSLETTTKQMRERIERHERSLKQMQSNIIAKETKLELAEKEKNKLLNAINAKDQELDQMRLSSSSEERDPNELSIIEMKIRNQELEKVLNNINTELRANQIRFDEQKNQLIKECSELKNKLLEERLRSEKLAKNDGMQKIRDMSEKLIISDNKVSELQTELNSLKTSINNNNIENNSEIIKIKNEKIRSLESNVKLLTKKYREMIQSKKNLEERLKSDRESEKVATKLVSTQTEEFDEKCNLEMMEENRELMNRINGLKQEIRSKELVIEENQRIILNLEHERGKLSSAGESSTNNHIQSLEIIIASKREEVMDLTEKLSEKNQTLKEMEINLNKKIIETENELKKERALIKDLRLSVFSEKRENNHLKKDLNELKRALSESNAIADKRKQELIDLQNEMQTINKIESSLRTEIDRIGGQMKAVKEENESLKHKMDNSNKRNEPLLEQFKNLSLNLTEKNQEIEGLKSQFSSVRERYESQVQALKQRIENCESDSQHMNNELSDLRKTKFSLQSRLTELRLHLKNSYEQNQKLRQQLNSYEAAVSQESTFNEELVTKLLDQTADNAKEIKPMVNLQACVESLKMEMQLLQKQISDHN